MLSYDCNSCDEEFEMDMDCTVINVYDEVEFNHIYTVCENCGKEMVLFFAEPEYLTSGYPVCHNGEAPWVIRHIWAQMFDPENLPEDPRTADQEMDAVVERRFHDWLDHVNPGDFNVSS